MLIILYRPDINPALSSRLLPGSYPSFLGRSTRHPPIMLHFTGKLHNILTPFFETEINNIMADVIQRFETSTFSHKERRAKRSPMKGTVSRDFFFRFFFHESVSQAPEDPIRTVSNFVRKFASQGAPQLSTTPVANLSPVSHSSDGNIVADFNSTGGKFTTGINDTGGKFCHQYR
jgi:hypothetical protein